MSLPPRLRVPLGVRHMAASAFFFSLMSLQVKLAGSRLPSSELVLGRAVVCLFLSWIWLRRAGVSAWGKNPRQLLLRGLLGTVGLICFYYAIVSLPLAEAVVIANTSPILTAILAALVLSEPATPRLVAAILCGAGGVLAIVRPAFLFGGGGAAASAAALDPGGVIVGFTGALASACAYVLIRRIGDRENPLVMVFYFPLVTVPVILPFALSGWLWPTPGEWLLLVGLGVATQLAQIHMTRGLVLLPAGRATAVGYIQVVLATIWGAIFFAEVPDLITLGGALLILVAILSLSLTGSAHGRAGERDGIVAG